MKAILVAAALSLTVLNAQADCVSKATDTLNTLRNVNYTARTLPVSLGAILLGAGGPLFGTVFGTAYVHSEVYDFRAILKDAEANGGENLDKLAEAIKDMRPDLANDKDKLASILREANQKETVCGNGYITGTLFRTLLMGGDIEAANAENHKISVNDFNNKIDG